MHHDISIASSTFYPLQQLLISFLFFFTTKSVNMHKLSFCDKKHYFKHLRFTMVIQKWRCCSNGNEFGLHNSNGHWFTIRYCTYLLFMWHDWVDDALFTIDFSLIANYHTHNDASFHEYPIFQFFFCLLLCSFLQTDQIENVVVVLSDQMTHLMANAYDEDEMGNFRNDVTSQWLDILVEFDFNSVPCTANKHNITNKKTQGIVMCFRRVIASSSLPYQFFVQYFRSYEKWLTLSM